jgi:ribonuclease-3
MITPAPGSVAAREQNPAYVPLSPASLPLVAMQARRSTQLAAFLERSGILSAASIEALLREDGLALVEEALTHTSSARPRHHERLEFLGDAVLRLAASEFLRRQHPDLSVGRWSALRAQLVSDRWLAELADRLDLAAVLVHGPMALAEVSGRATVLAECCEALIGAVYGLGGGPVGGLETVLCWLEPHWQRDIQPLFADPHAHNWKSALQEWGQGRGLGLPDYACEERSRRHGDPRRFHCRASLAERELGEGWGGSRREAEQQAARAALAALAEGEEPPLKPAPGS